MASISKMKLRLAKLQESDAEAWKIIAENLDGNKNVNKELHYQELPFVPEIIWTELIRKYYNNQLAKHFNINKTRKHIN